MNSNPIKQFLAFDLIYGMLYLKASALKVLINFSLNKGATDVQVRKVLDTRNE